MAPEELLTLPRTRHEAMSVGSNKYFTGKACKHGHISVRSTNAARCLKCLSIFQMARDPEKMRARAAKYRLENPEKVKASFAKRMLENPGKVKASHVKWRLNNPEKVLQNKRNHVQLLSSSYISNLLKEPTKQLTPEIIELKRLQIQLFRAIKSIKESK